MKKDKIAKTELESNRSDVVDDKVFIKTPIKKIVKRKTIKSLKLH